VRIAPSRGAEAASGRLVGKRPESDGPNDSPTAMAESATSRPPFDPDRYAAEVFGAETTMARSASPRLDEDLVLRCVPDVSWSEARLDFDELYVLRNIDGVAPVLLLESFVDLPREQLRSILFLLISRGIVAIAPPALPSILGTSGFFARGAHAERKIGSAG
jgi:hypothetical protein